MNGSLIIEGFVETRMSVVASAVTHDGGLLHPAINRRATDNAPWMGLELDSSGVGM
jgi:hypothetical protein